MQIANLTQNANRDNPQCNRVYDPEGLAPCIHCMGGGNLKPLIIEYMKEKKIIQRPHGFNKGNTFEESPAVTTSSFENNNMVALPPELQGKKFRIRKLTPRECFRLMGVADKDIDRIQATGISNSKQYQLAGNSIVVDVLFHLFRKLFIDPDEPDYQEGKQLSLF